MTLASSSLTTTCSAASDTETDWTKLLAPAQGPGELGQLGIYRVLRVLGAGGMGVVFAAEDMQLGRPVALKIVRPALATSAEVRERFLREARAAAAVKHDHIVTIYQVGEARGMPFLAMEYLDGETLEARLRRDGPLLLAELLRIAREIAEGLAAAHGRGVIHRDIKPSNIWLEAREQRAESREQSAERREQRAESRGQRSEDREQERSAALTSDLDSLISSRVKILDFGSITARICSVSAACSITWLREIRRSCARTRWRR
jgi:serine/threonine protein kinase